jgi:hypothetical protein
MCDSTTHFRFLTFTTISPMAMALTGLSALDSGAGALQSSDGQPLRNFEVVGQGGKYAPSSVEVCGDEVIVFPCL